MEKIIAGLLGQLREKDNGDIDFNNIKTGPDLKSFDDNDLFSYLSSFRNKAESINSLEYKIGEIFLN